ncbi:MAG: hypothetical protein HRU33_15685 [Rhodobacteraceae bacterium]|nr:hypothetical protein [Paracoccaceae bacterium]
MDDIQIAPETWAQSLPQLLATYQHSDTAAGQVFALAEMEKMAFLADKFGKPLCIEVFAMAERDTNDYGIAERGEEIHSYDILVRCDGEDPIEEHESIAKFSEVLKIVEGLQKKFPGASLDEIGG